MSFVLEAKARGVAKHMSCVEVRVSVWEKNSGTLRMACGGPGRGRRKGREPNRSHEWQGG